MSLPRLGTLETVTLCFSVGSFLTVFLASVAHLNPKRDWKPFFKWFKDNGFAEVDNFDVVFTKEEGFGLASKNELKQGVAAFEVCTNFL